jgi:hypothetical protein
MILRKFKLSPWKGKKSVENFRFEAWFLWKI